MLKNNHKKKYLFLVCFLILVVILIVGVTYAYFDLAATDEETITGTVGGANLALSVTRELPDENPSNMIPQLESTLVNAVNSPYLCIDDNNNVVCQVYKVTIQNTGSISTVVVGSIVFSDIDQLPNLKWRRMDGLTTYGEYDSYAATTTDHVFEEGKVLNPSESFDYYFVIWVNEIGETQEDEGTFHAIINFNAVIGGGSSVSVDPTGAAKDIIDLYQTTGDTITTVNIANDESKPEVSLNSTRGIMLDNNGEYRYYGANPNNYVSFNGELWRIISVSNVKSSETDTVGEYRVKIIRNDSIGYHSWDSSASTVNSGYGVNDWSQADLNTELNNLYYNKQSGTCYHGKSNESTTCDFTSTGLSEDAKNLISDALWYLGGSSIRDGLYADDYYNFERSTTVWGSTSGQTCDDGSCPRATKWTGKVGLMYPSDYVYATVQNLCTIDVYDWDSESSSDTSCTDNNWLYSSIYNQQTISSDSSTPYFVFYVSSLGFVGVCGASSTNDIRPVVYLNSNVEISGGSGTDQVPYQLSIAS